MTGFIDMSMARKVDKKSYAQVYVLYFFEKCGIILILKNVLK